MQIKMNEIYVNLDICECHEIFDKHSYCSAESCITAGVTEILYDQESGDILATVQNGEFLTLDEKYTSENIKTFTNISELRK